jgi:hypothetical protein
MLLILRFQAKSTYTNFQQALRRNALVSVFKWLIMKSKRAANHAGRSQRKWHCADAGGSPALGQPPFYRLAVFGEPSA